MRKKEYSCVKKTKRAFAQSLAELAKEYPLNKITVKALCEKAELSRNAFYFHYADIYALVEDVENDLIGNVEKLLEDFRKIGFPDNVLETIKRLPELLMAQKDITSMLLDSNYSTSFTARLNKLFSDFNYEYFVQFHKTTPREIYDYFYTFICDGFYGMLRKMLKNPDSISIEKFTSLAYTLIKRILILDDTDLKNEG